MARTPALGDVGHYKKNACDARGRCDGELLALSRGQLVGPVAAHDRPRDRSGPLGTARDQPGPAGTGRDQSGRSGPAEAAQDQPRPLHYLRDNGPLPKWNVTLRVLGHNVRRTHWPRAKHIIPRPLHTLLQPDHMHCDLHDRSEQRERATPRRAQCHAPVNHLADQVLHAPAIVLH